MAAQLHIFEQNMNMLELTFYLNSILSLFSKQKLKIILIVDEFSLIKNLNNLFFQIEHPKSKFKTIRK
jgi:hypothetical protein